MGDKTSTRITYFDSIYTTSELRILKLLLPYLDTKSAPSIAIFIKYMELKYTINNQNLFCKCNNMSSSDSNEFMDILDCLCDFSNDEMKEKIAMLKDLMDLMNSFGGDLNADNISDIMSML